MIVIAGAAGTWEGFSLEGGLKGNRAEKEMKEKSKKKKDKVWGKKPRAEMTGARRKECGTDWGVMLSNWE